MEGEELLQYNTSGSEAVQTLLGGMGKVNHAKAEAAKEIEFYAAPFRHPLFRVLTRVRRFLENCSNRIRSEAANTRAEIVTIRAALREAAMSEDDSVPVPRKVPGGSGRFLQMLRFPLAACQASLNFKTK